MLGTLAARADASLRCLAQLEPARRDATLEPGAAALEQSPAPWRLPPALAPRRARRTAALIDEVLQVGMGRPRTFDDATRCRLLRCLEGLLPAVDAGWLARIEQAQQRQPGDAGLQYLASRQAYLQRQLWEQGRDPARTRPCTA